MGCVRGGAELIRREIEPTNALSAWRDALELLPRAHDTRSISARVSSLSEKVDRRATCRRKDPVQPIPVPLPQKRHGSEKSGHGTVAVVGLALTRATAAHRVDQGRHLWSMLLSFGV